MVNSAPAKPGRHAHAASAIFLYSLERGSPEPIKATLPENWSERDDGGAPSPLRSPSCRPVVLLSWANDVRRHFAFTSIASSCPQWRPDDAGQTRWNHEQLRSHPTPLGARSRWACAPGTSAVSRDILVRIKTAVSQRSIGIAHFDFAVCLSIIQSKLVVKLNIRPI
jgi:hypothetical protein